MFQNLEKQVYIDDQGGWCPKCENEFMREQDDTLRTEWGEFVRRRSCSSCGFKWEEVFQMVEVRPPADD